MANENLNIKRIAVDLTDKRSITATLSSSVIKGFSAYDIAVSQGFKGTVEEWIESLKGEKVQLRENGNAIEWKYENDSTWMELIKLKTLNDYELLMNKPSVDGNTLIGNLDLTEIYVRNENVLTNFEIEELLK